MRPQLKDYAYPAIKEFIKQKVEESGGNGVVIGLSGGIDSALVTKLCVDAVGAERVLNLFLPCKVTCREDREEVERFSKLLGTELKTVDIQPAVDAFMKVLPETRERRDVLGNAMSRCRMIVLYHYAKIMGRVVMGTSNKSELLIGYTTKFGDGGADFAPIGALYKTEVRELAVKLDLPESIIRKIPAAGLWADQTDEEELGIKYDDLDRILYGLEMGLSNREIAEKTNLSLIVVDRVWEMHRCSVHKRKMPLIPKLGIRTIGLDWRE